MADPETKPICMPSAGVHIVLPAYYWYDFELFFKNKNLVHQIQVFWIHQLVMDV